MKKSIKKILFLGAILLIFSILYYILLRLPIDNILPIYTYKGMVLLGITTIFIIIVGIILRKKELFNIDDKDVIITVLIFLMIHLLVFGMIAITIERSFSVFMLSEISKIENKTISLEETEKLFIEKYVNSHSAFEKRFAEQIVTGTVEEISPNNYKLTKKGDLIVVLFNLFNYIYNVNSELL